jgi:hypothetical protein
MSATYHCPKCKKEVNIIHVGKAHYGACMKCKIRWLIGHNLFPVSDVILEHEEDNKHFLSEHFTNITDKT